MFTHEVTNQVPPLTEYDASAHPAVQDALDRAGVGEAREDISRLGRLAGSADSLRLGDLAERNTPILHTHDRYGNRVDEIEYDPAYHALMTTAFQEGIHAAAWADPDPNAHLIRAAKLGTWQLVDCGHTCPVSMSYASIPALRATEAHAAVYEPLLVSREYDPELRLATEKRGISAGMSMTEKQGGSDVRTNTTMAEPLADGSYRIVGHKWFTSAPMSDLLLTLAVAPGGLSCFVLPRVLPDGTLNGIRLQRLKDKLGNHSNASSEIEYENAIGWLLGEEGRGVATIVEMVNGTRLDCTIGSAALMRHALDQAVHHATHRFAFGSKLIDKPLMRNVLADLVVEAEGATTVALWLASLTDQAEAGDERAALLRRLGLAASKYWVCKRAPSHVGESLETLGGNGYIEDSRLPKMYREAPLLSIWEGSGNVAALDALRAIARQPRTLEVMLDEMRIARGSDQRFDAALSSLETAFATTKPEDLEYGARGLVGRLATVLQGSLLLRFGDAAVADAFVGSRLGAGAHGVYGELDQTIDTAAILARAHRTQ